VEVGGQAIHPGDFGPGGGKAVVLKITVDTNVLICGMLFTLVMGRLGGLLPALSGMRLGILESLR